MYNSVVGQTFEAIYEGGDLHPTKPLPLPERARVRLAIVDDPFAMEIAAAAARSKTFEFLARADEDIYSRDDGEPV